MASAFPPLQLTVEQLAAFLDQAFPAKARPALGRIASVAPGHARLILDPDDDMARPGGVVSGPVQMGLIDVAAYAVLLAHIGVVPMAVTHSLNVAFLRGCTMAPVIADARLLKLGRRLATIEVRLWQSDESLPVAQATVGYALP